MKTIVFLAILSFCFFCSPVFAVDLGNGVEYIPQNRKIGVGTRSPSEQLTVNGNFALKENSEPEQTSGYGKIFINLNDKELYFRASDQSSVKVTNNGSLAVSGYDNLGNHTATQNLNLSGYDINGVNRIKVENGTVSNPSISFITNQGSGLYLSNSNGEVSLATSGAQRMVISGSSGNVSIGTSVSNTKLLVNGTTMSKLLVNESFYTLTSSSNVNINWNDGNKQIITLAHNPIFTFTAPSYGVGSLTLILGQDNYGNRTVTWPSSVKWPGGTDPVLSTAPGYIDIVTCIYYSSNYFCQIGIDFQ